MVRIIPSGRLRELVEAASRVFIELGYRRTQMADVARALELGKGTLYGYVESKDALFYLVIAYADRPVPDVTPESLPIATPAPGALQELAAERMAETGEAPMLKAALKRDRSESIADEFESIVRELYASLSANRTAIKLADRCALDVQELAQLWSEGGRNPQLDALTRYLASRAAAGQVVAFDELSVAARMLLETVTTWAVHIHWDRTPQKIDSRVAEDTVVAVLRRGFIREDRDGEI